jgi:CRP-like cAMP-binding protein
MDLVDILKTAALFDGLTDAQLYRIIDISEPMTVSKGETIFSQGDTGDRLYVVSEGEVEVRVGLESGDERSQVFLGRGQLFGEIALIDKGPRSATMVCTRDNTTLYTISCKTFIDLCMEDTAIGYVVMRNIAADLSFKLRHRNLSRL